MFYFWFYWFYYEIIIFLNYCFIFMVLFIIDCFIYILYLNVVVGLIFSFFIFYNGDFILVWVFNIFIYLYVYVYLCMLYMCRNMKIL